MATIIYGVAGEGLGHSVRTKVVVNHLKKKGHRVLLFGGGNAFAFLSKEYPIRKIGCFRFVHRKNSVSVVRTTLLNLIRLPEMIARYFSLLRIIRKTRPDLIITDLEPFTSYAAKSRKIPSISLSFPFLSIPFTKKYKVTPTLKSKIDYLLTIATLSTLLKKPSLEIIPTFFHQEFSQKGVITTNPILREKVLSSKQKKGNHILVYQTTNSNKKLLESLRKMDERCIVYGFGKEGKEGNLHFKKMSDEGFLRDLTDCKAIIANGGFSLMAEAIHLQKPLLAIPVGSRYEQILNARYLEKFGYGLMAKEGSIESIRLFLSKLKSYEDNLKRRKKYTDDDFFKKLDSAIEEFTRS